MSLSKSRYRQPAGRTAALLTCLLVFSLVAAAGPISFPISLDPTVPNGWLLATHVHACGGCVPDLGDEETYLSGGTTSQVGTLSLASLASGPGGGAFSDLTHGALAVDSVGFPDGSGQVTEAFLIVNLPIAGSGTNTVHFRINGSSAVDGCVNIACENSFSSSLSIFSVGGIQASTSGGGCEGFSGCTGIPFPEDLSLSFNTTSQSHIYQFTFFLLGRSNGFAGIFAAHTGLISFDLAQGVTMDNSSGFLTQPGDPLAGPETSAPEPSTAALIGGSLLGLCLLVVRRRRRPASRC